MNTYKFRPDIISNGPPLHYAFRMLPNSPKEIVALTHEITAQKFKTESEARFSFFELGRMHERLETKCFKLQDERSGIWAFFMSYFNSGAYAEQKNLLEEMESKRRLIEDFVQAEPAIETVSQAVEKDAETVPLNMPNQPIPLEVPSQENAPSVSPSAKLPNQRPAPYPLPPSQPSQPSQPPLPPPPPPPPPFAPSSMGRKQVDGTTGSVEIASVSTVAPKNQSLTPSKKYLIAEREKLQRKLEERANPDLFYTVLLPKNANELEQTKRILLSDIERIKRINDGQWLEEKILALARVAEQLQPPKLPLRYADVFRDKVAKYTNQELCFIIGIMFNGKKPEQKHPLYSYYLPHQEILDRLFKDWDSLVLESHWQEFMKHAENWRRYLEINLFGFCETLRRRMLPPKNRDHLNEPTYQILPYEMRKKPRPLALGSNGSKENLGSLNQELNKRIGKKV